MKSENPVGRPLQYKTVEALQAVIDEYFEWCDNRIVTVYKDEKEITYSKPAPYTMSGLARRLNLSRQALMEYSHREKYGDAIKKARDRIQEDVETRLMETPNQTGAIFNLKNNFEWRDKTEVGVEGGVKQIVELYKIEKDKLYAEFEDDEGESSQSTT